MSGSIMYLVMLLNKWEEINLESIGRYHLPFPAELITPTDGSIGFCEVYDTRENALKAHPNAVVLPIELSPDKRLPDVTYKIADKLPEKLEYPLSKKKRKHA